VAPIAGSRERKYIAPAVLMRSLRSNYPVEGLEVKAAEQLGITGERRKRLIAQPIAEAG
jgi:hypothetical protein